MAIENQRTAGRQAQNQTRATAHNTLVCTLCRHTGRRCFPGYALISRLRHALDVAGRMAVLDADFTIDGVAHMAGCDRPCMVAYRADATRCYLFGDVEADPDIDALVLYATHHMARGGDCANAPEHPGEPGGQPLARMPSALVIEHQRPAQTI